MSRARIHESGNKPAIGYMGLGNAGYPLASALSKAGYLLVLQDATASREQPFITEHDSAISASSIAAASNVVDVSITMVTHSDIARDVPLGAQGVVKAMKDGTVIIDTSSSSPFQTRETAEVLEEIHPSLILVDAPVTQGYEFALAKR